MRLLCRLLLSSVLVLAAGCSAPAGTTYLAPIPEATIATYRPGSPVETRPEAVIAARKILEAPGFNWIGSPRAMLVEQMSYAGAESRIGLGDAQYDLWPPETRVWLVIFEGRWQLMPLGPAATVPLSYEGCLRALLAARDGSFISAGDAVCPAQP